MSKQASYSMPARLCLQRSALAVAISVSLAAGVPAAEITVSGPCTLVDAVLAANSDASVNGCTAGNNADKLILDGDSYYLSAVYGPDSDGKNGLPLISTDITIQGNGSTILRLSGSAFRLFNVTSSGSLSLSNVTLSNGQASISGEGFEYAGGAILNRGNLSVIDSTLSGNSSAGEGGALANFYGTASLTNTIVENNNAALGGGLRSQSGSLTLTNTTVRNNSATGNGGGIYSRSSTDRLNISGGSIDNNQAQSGAGLNIIASTVTLNSVTISQNTASQFGGGLRSTGSSATLSHVTLNNSVLLNNRADQGGGMSNNWSIVTLNTVTVSGNSASSQGGGGSSANGTVTLNASTISGNSAGERGGGWFAGTGDLNINRSTISDNSANNYGGGLATLGGSAMVRMSNCTLSANSAGSSGGGINNIDGTVEITNCTLSGNSAAVSGGGISTTGVVQLRNSIVANTPAGDDCFGPITLGGKNWSEDGTCLSPSTPSGDSGLGALADNGGPSLTHALLPGSGAINAGDNALCALTPISPFDQRGEARRSGGRCDLGAFELQQPGGFFVIPAGGGKVVVIPSG